MTEDSNGPDERRDADERPMFAHQPWMVGMVLMFAVMAIIAGLSDPIWLLLGAPFIVVLALFIYMRITSRHRS